jgi:hypothetical protein
MPLEIGNTFINKKTTQDAPKKHLWIIISYPFGEPEQIIIANLTSWRTEATATELNDASCIVDVGEHDFVKEKSYIFYREAHFAKTKDFEEAINKGLVISQDDCSDELLCKILVGASKSNLIPFGIINILQQQELIDYPN